MFLTLEFCRSISFLVLEVVESARRVRFLVFLSLEFVQSVSFLVFEEVESARRVRFQCLKPLKRNLHILLTV